MNISTDIKSTTPLFSQLMDQIKQAIQYEELKPGAVLTSIRQLANDLDLNSETVAKA